DASAVPSGLKATDCTSSVCPLSVARSLGSSISFCGAGAATQATASAKEQQSNTATRLAAMTQSLRANRQSLSAAQPNLAAAPSQPSTLAVGAGFQALGFQALDRLDWHPLRRTRQASRRLCFGEQRRLDAAQRRLDAAQRHV